VWESVIHALPPSVTLVMLSASFGDAAKHGAWVGSAHRRRGGGGASTRPLPGAIGEEAPPRVAATGALLPATPPRRVALVTTPARVVPLTCTVLVTHGVGWGVPSSEATVVPTGAATCSRPAYAAAVAPAKHRRALVAAQSDNVTVVAHLVARRGTPAVVLVSRSAVDGALAGLLAAPEAGPRGGGGDGDGGGGGDGRNSDGDGGGTRSTSAPTGQPRPPLSTRASRWICGFSRPPPGIAPLPHCRHRPQAGGRRTPRPPAHRQGAG